MAYSEIGTPFSISANLPSVYSAAHYFSGIPLIGSVMLTDIAKGLIEEMCEYTEFTLRIYGAVQGNHFIKHEIKKERFRLSDYVLRDTNSASFELHGFRLIPDADFMSGLTSPCSATLTVSVTIGGRSTLRSFGIRLLPFGYICPEMPPELYAAYVLPGCGLGRRVYDVYSNEKPRLPKDNIFRIAELCASVMKSANLTYSPLLRELLQGECVIRDYDTVAISNNRSLSLTEAVLLYCSMAESIGLRPVAVFFRKDTDAVKAFVGINLSKKPCSAVCESMLELRERILSKDIFLFDILGLLGTEATDFARNASETTSSVFKMNASTVLAVDIIAARALGVRSMRPAYKECEITYESGYKNVAEAVSKTDEIGRNRALFGFSPYSGHALGICAKANSLEFGKEYTVYAIDEDVLCSEPDSFSFISTFKPHSSSEHPRNMTEKAVYDGKIKKLMSRIESERCSGGLYMYSASGFLSGKKLSGKIIRDDFNSDISVLCEAVRNKLLSDGHVEIYAAAGSVAYIKDGKTIYVPCAYVPCSLSVDTETVRLRYGTDRAILNLCLADETESILGKPEAYGIEAPSGCRARQEELSRILSHYARLSNYDSEFTYHPDTFLSVFDLSYTLMRGCIESTSGKRFERYLVEGEYTPCEKESYYYGRTEATIPFATPTVFTDAVLKADNDSIIITGPLGSGKKAAVANIAVRNHNAGLDTLICSKYSETLEAVRETFKEKGLSELCIILQNDIKTRKQILSDIKKLTSAADIPQYIEGEVSEFEEVLDSYAERLHSKRSFGYSLYECINEYCLCSEKASEEPLPILSRPYDLTPSDINELLEVSELLCKKTKALSDAAAGTSIHELMLDKLGISAPLSQDVKQLLYDAAHELSVFSEKSAAARLCLGIPQKALSDVRALRAFGDFLESVIFSGIDFMPEKLLEGGAYASAKKVEEVCAVIDELKGFGGKLDDVSPEIAEISTRNLYLKWQTRESNPFVRASVLHELKKYLPSTKKPTSSEAGALLELLARREELTSELERLTPECSEILGQLWKGKNTDTETARRAARFAVLSDSCSNRMSRSTEGGIDLRKCITSLISGLKNEGEARADLLLSAGAFRKLAGNGKGLLDAISRALTVDLYEMKFEDGILSEKGLAKLLDSLALNTEVLGMLPEYNALKKRAASLGVSSFTEYARIHEGDNGCMWLFRKSIFASLSKSVIDSDDVLSAVSSKDYEEYIKLYKSEKERCVYSVVSSHRDSFAQYISSPEGKNELQNLCDELRNAAFTVFEIFTRHSALLREMYSVILALNTDAYRFSQYPSSLILFDCDKTDAAEAIPLCAHFDRCVFVSCGNERKNSIMKLIPKGIPCFESRYVLCGRNGSVLRLCEMLSEHTEHTRCIGFKDIHFVKCEGGMYDRNTRTNRIEALTACETALAASKNHGLENVGILAATTQQAAEIIQILGVLAGKYDNPSIASVPVRYIGRVGDFSKDVIVFSAAFGKNVYSVTRSFGIFDDYAARNEVSAKDGSAAIIEELLCCKKKLFVVSSVEPGDIMTDTLGSGAELFAAILRFARYGAVPKKPVDSEAIAKSGIERTLALQLEDDDRDSAISASKGVIFSRTGALIYDESPDIPCFDRTVLRYDEYTGRGYNVSFVLPTELLPKEQEIQ